MPVLEGHTILSQRPNARFHVLLHGEDGYRWRGEERLHATQADAYDAMGLPPDQAPPDTPFLLSSAACGAS